MRKGDDGLEMTLEELAGSGRRVWDAVTGGEPQALDELPGDEAARWLAACRWARLSLPGYDGRPVPEAVAAFLDQWAAGDDALRRQQHAYPGEWEAVVRHLAALCDSDELDGEGDVLDLEKTWPNWLARRPRRQVVEAR